MAKKFDVSRIGIATVLRGTLVLVLLTLGMGSSAAAALNTTDSHIINLYLLNEGVAGESLNNSVPNSFIDSAVTGTAQNHDNVSWAAPVWGSGANFAGIGDGNGLTFSNAEFQMTRFKPWMNVSQGDYTPGKSFTIMTRMYATSLVDNASYGLIGQSSNYIGLYGKSGNQGTIKVQIREGVGGGETKWNFHSYVSGGDPGITSWDGLGWFSINQNTWYNLFVIYDADTSITIATDDGTTLKWIKDSNVPASFSTLANGYADPTYYFVLGNYYAAISEYYPTFDGRIESVAIWDKALTIAEADAIGLTNEAAFAPADCAGVIANGYRLAGDVTGPNNVPDCHVNMADLAKIVEQWLVCNNPGQSGCIENW